MAYIIASDYSNYIQPAYFNQLTQSQNENRIRSERDAMTRIIAYLKPKYDINAEFADITVWSPSKEYQAQSRVYLNADAYVAASAYVVDDLCLQGGYVQICTTNTTGTFDQADWTILGAQYKIFYGALPDTCTLHGLANPSTLSDPFAPIFNYRNVYMKGDVVYWKGNTYVCNQDTVTISHTELIQRYFYNNVTHVNVFPNDQYDNANGKYWKDATVFTIEAGTLPTDAAWIDGDNRNPMVLRAMKAIVVYRLAPTLAPQNIPKMWENEYNEAVNDMKMAACGDITLDLLMVQPNKGRKLFIGSNTQYKTDYK